jgi:thiol-disulfide isomerase/thioredoxin
MKRNLLLALAVGCATLCRAEQPLPWEKDFPTALAKAKAAKQPLFLMLTATWCGPCKMLESQTLTADSVRSALKEFVWVKAYEDKALNSRFHLGGYPTLVFLDSQGEQILEHTTGYELPEPFLRHVLVARKAAHLPLTPQMESLLAKQFKQDPSRLDSFIAQGDADGLVNYLKPAKDDALRGQNYLVATLHLPSDLDRDDVIFSVYGQRAVPPSGVVLTIVPRDQKKAPVRISAPGCMTLVKEFPMPGDAAVAQCELSLQRLSDADAASLSGRVLRGDGSPVPHAIVRVCDWDVTRADAQGRFRLARISPGEYTVRGEAPGGETQETITFAAGKELKRDITLKPVTTVGIRWALQREEGSLQLSGPRLRSGEAYFSVAHSRFLLSRGAEVPESYGSDFMLRADWQGVRQFLKPGQLAVLEKTAPGTPIYWLFDSGMHPNGLHEESGQFGDISVINNGQPADKAFFKFLRGEPVRKGQLFTLRCVRKDCYAKMEITDLTIVPPPSTHKAP